MSLCGQERSLFLDLTCPDPPIFPFSDFGVFENCLIKISADPIFLVTLGLVHPRVSKAAADQCMKIVHSQVSFDIILFYSFLFIFK